MEANHRPIQNIALAIHPTSPEAMKEGLAVKAFIQENWGLDCLISRVNDPTFIEHLEESKFDLMITLGGDGTMLRAGHLCAPVNVPLLGINLGRFGFLMQVARNEWKAVLPRIFNDEFTVEDRMMLQAEVWRGELMVQSSQVINDVVVCRGQTVRPIRIHASVDGYSLAYYMADGLIAATPTGSTAYALAVGGPIMPPELRNILIVAVAPHLSLDRAVILPEGACVEITTDTDHEAVVSIDGHAPVVLQNGDRVKVKASDYTVKFLTFKDPGYFYRNLGNYLKQNPAIGGFK